MRPIEFKELLVRLKRLPLNQRRELLEVLKEAEPPEDVVEIINARTEERQCCPSCGSTSAQRWGFEKGIQRYRCRECKRTYNALTGTNLAHLKRRDAWLSYAQAIADGKSLRKAAVLASINYTTAFRWRHRLLVSPRDHKDREMEGIVEADETYFLESFKGSRELPRQARKRGGTAATRGMSREQIAVLVVRDRSGRHFDEVLPVADQASIGRILPKLLTRESVLCTDGANVYKAVAKARGIAHEPLNHRHGGRIKQRVFHIQNVNAYDSRLKRWMSRFNGVATKYLPNYLGWHRMIEQSREALTPPKLLQRALG
ncbi:MAG: IS1595 family transposase [Solidesulfovibrio sp.]